MAQPAGCQEIEQSFFGSIAVVFVLVLLSCRSLRLSLIAVVTCLLPVLCVLAAGAVAGVRGGYAPVRPR